MSNIIHLIFTPEGPKACFKGLTPDEVYRKFEHKNSKLYSQSRNKPIRVFTY